MGALNSTRRAEGHIDDAGPGSRYLSHFGPDRRRGEADSSPAAIIRRPYGGWLTAGAARSPRRNWTTAPGLPTRLTGMPLWPARSRRIVVRG